MLKEPLLIDEKHDLLKPVIYAASPHCDNRPENMMIDTVIIHGISLPRGHFGNNLVTEFFCGTLDFNAYPELAYLKALRVAAHLLIKRTGEIIQFVPFNKRAWHAGVSFFDGREQCNDFSIGIELEGTDDVSYELIQYLRLAKVIRLLMQRYPGITMNRIVGHSDVAPGRKTDPGPHFNWEVLRGLIK